MSKYVKRIQMYSLYNQSEVPPSLQPETWGTPLIGFLGIDLTASHLQWNGELVHLSGDAEVINLVGIAATFSTARVCTSSICHHANRCHLTLVLLLA